MKMYKQPSTEVAAVNTEYMMLDLNVSNGGTPPDEGPAHAPARGEIIP